MEEKKLETKDRYAFAAEKSRKQIFLDNLVGGVAWGVGSIIGASIIVGLFGIIITQTRNVPLVGDIINVVIQEIESGRDVDFLN
jgi:hypothetical protein